MADARPAARIGAVVEFDPEPGGCAAHARAYRGRVLADARGEHQRIQSPERGSKGTQLAHDTVDEQIDRLGRVRIAAGEQRAHVAGYAGDPQQSRLMIEQFLQPARIHAIVVEQVQQHTRIDRAAACSHRQSIKSGESHGACRALACGHSAHARAVAQVRHDGATGCGAHVDRGQHLGDIFIRQAVEPVATYAGLSQVHGQRECLRQRRLRRVECGIEAGHLNEVGYPRRDRADGGKIVRLVQGRERHQSIERFEHRRTHPHRR